MEIEGEYSYDVELPSDWREVGIEVIKEFLIKEKLMLSEEEGKKVEWRHDGDRLHFRLEGGERCL